jgi:hypothetical protein
MRAVTLGLKILILCHDHVWGYPPYDVDLNLLLHLYMPRFSLTIRSFPLFKDAHSFFGDHHVLFSILPYYSCFLLFYEQFAFCIQIAVFIYIISLSLLGIRFGLVHTLRTEHSG